MFEIVLAIKTSEELGEIARQLDRRKALEGDDTVRLAIVEDYLAQTLSDFLIQDELLQEEVAFRAASEERRRVAKARVRRGR